MVGGEILDKERTVNLGKSIPGRGNSKWKAPELGTPVCLRDCKRARVVVGD